MMRAMKDDVSGTRESKATATMCNRSKHVARSRQGNVTYWSYSLRDETQREYGL